MGNGEQLERSLVDRILELTVRKLGELDSFDEAVVAGIAEAGTEGLTRTDAILRLISPNLGENDAAHRA
jgi:hypothetical protein